MPHPSRVQFLGTQTILLENPKCTVYQGTAEVTFCFNQQQYKLKTISINSPDHLCDALLPTVKGPKLRFVFRGTKWGTIKIEEKAKEIKEAMLKDVAPSPRSIIPTGSVP